MDIPPPLPPPNPPGLADAAVEVAAILKSGLYQITFSETCPFCPRDLMVTFLHVNPETFFVSS